MVPCPMAHDLLGQTRCALEVLGILVRLSLSETLHGVKESYTGVSLPGPQGLGKLTLEKVKIT